jgi:hypothetical protein
MNVILFILGHSRTNRECPLYVPKDINNSNSESNQVGNIAKMQGTKLIIDKRLILSK